MFFVVSVKRGLILMGQSHEKVGEMRVWRVFFKVKILLK
jgi:hypothetical protein